MKKITATPKTAAEITGIKGCETFEGTDERGYYCYAKSMNNLARATAGKAEELVFKKWDKEHSREYDYTGVFSDKKHDSFDWRKEWLKNIREEVDWSAVPVDAKVVVRNPKIRRHFWKYENGRVYTFPYGKTSWSADMSDGDLLEWYPFQVELAEEKE